MTSTLVTAILGKLLVSFVYGRGITLVNPTPVILKAILSFVCSVGTLFVWEALTIRFAHRSIALPFLTDRVIFFGGFILLLVVYMVLDKIVFGEWSLPKGPVGFGVRPPSTTNKPNSRSYVYADSVPIRVKGDGWVRK